ncbi:MAG: PilZ domain-containing protein [Azoarcus sp.]|nr:PilZ domain-containing protein [Azoarcus sp.]
MADRAILPSGMTSIMARGRAGVTIGSVANLTPDRIMDYASPRDRRLDRRIPLGCSASIRAKNGDEIVAECIELSVSGMTLHVPYVPGEGEVIEVVITSPNERLTRPPLVTHLRVTRCHALPDGRYEIGGATVRVVG